jgi:hypothetical protein
MLVWIAYGVAAGTTLLLARHVARRYPSAPKRLPAKIGIDGRPSPQTVPRAILWIFPAILAVVLAILAAALAADPVPAAKQPLVVLVFVTIVEVAWLMAWLVDRQIEIARKMTYRVAPGRLFGACAPLLATVAAILVLAFRI